MEREDGTPTKLDGTPAKNASGRPPKFDAVLAEKVIRHVRDGLFLETACNLVGLNVQTCRKWLVTGARAERGRMHEFCEAVKRARAEAEVDLLDGAKARAADSKEGWKERVWRLEHLNPRKYGPKLTVEFRNLVDEFLDHLEANLDGDVFEKVLAVAAGFDGEDKSSADEVD